MKLAFFGLNQKKEALRYDPQTQEPAVRKSICTGEMTVGFINRKTGVFEDIMRVSGQKELDAFLRSIGEKDIRTIY